MQETTQAAGGVVAVVQSTVTQVTQAVPVPKPAAAAVPSIPSVVDTQATVPTPADVTQQVDETADQTLQGVGGAVDDVKAQVQGAAHGLGDLSPGG